MTLFTYLTVGLQITPKALQSHSNTFVHSSSCTLSMSPPYLMVLHCTHYIFIFSFSCVCIQTTSIIYIFSLLFSFHMLLPSSLFLLLLLFTVAPCAGSYRNNFIYIANITHNLFLGQIRSLGDES